LRDLAGRYRGTLIGFGWVFVTPLLLLLVFTFVFNGVFNMKWPHSDWDSPLGFALFTFCGLLLHQALADTMARSPGLILSQPNLVTKVILPLWVLPASILGAIIFQLLVGLGVFLIVLAIVNGVHTSWITLPLLLVPFSLGLLGVALSLAALGVYLRDINQIIGLVIVLLMFLSPIFYPLSAVPEDMRFWLNLNPMAALMETLRTTLILGEWPGARFILLAWLLGGLFALTGIGVFRHLKRGFADVL
jgi:lipopolysaccharide transport system permease protein